MKRFLLNSAKLDGQIELVYKPCGMLGSINVMDVTLSYEQLGLIIQQLPLNADDMGLLPKGLKAVPAELEVGFDDFWKGTRKKVNKSRCEPIWNKMSKADQVLCVLSRREYYKCLDRTGRKEADPETYLKTRYWETDWKSIN
jgi:hypothetical protein